MKKKDRGIEELLAPLWSTENKMCGDCISIKLLGGHDPRVNKERTCRMCGTHWNGLEAGGRRKAILEQRARKR